MSVASRYTASGMTCEHCVRAVSGAISSLAGVESVVVDLASGRVDVRSQAPLERSEVERVMQDAGYEVRADAGREVRV
ncbi:heavy-metal-associated domain-containing protein [Plantactinospora sp. KBS50]|uniref:heavy-metal-associated domain-containing protein n=1 Tax=Plantactinospora sp. KBS50 TaxID=2024580 RepID=UPI0026B91A5E